MRAAERSRNVEYNKRTRALVADTKRGNYSYAMRRAGTVWIVVLFLWLVSFAVRPCWNISKFTVLEQDSFAGGMGIKYN